MTMVGFVASIVLILASSLFGALYLVLPSRRRNGEGSVQIVVLGDIGHSPRMQYHALSIANSKANVDIVGYAGM